MAEPNDERIRDLGSLAFGVAYRILRSRSDAEDVAQEAVIRTAIRWRRVHGYADPFTIRVAANLSIGLLRVRRPADVAAPVDDGGITTMLDRIDLAHALSRLPRRQREVVVLRYLADMSEREVADALGVSAGSVKQHNSRGLAALRRSMSRSDNHPPIPGVLDA